MGFAFPIFLAAMAAIAIPIIIHYFNFRKYKTIYFSNTKMLKTIQEQRNNIKDLKQKLILLCRVLAILALVMAFAQPFLGKKAQGKSSINSVVIYIDNSQSMALKNGSLSMLEIAKSRALEIVAVFSSADKFMLLTNDLEGFHQNWTYKKDVEKYIQEIGLSAQNRKLSEIISKQNNILSQSSTGNKKAYLISDGQKYISDFEAIKKDKNIQYNFLPLNAKNTSNIFIDTCWLVDPVSSPNASTRLAYRIINTDSKIKEKLNVTLKINQQAKSVNLVDVPAKGFITDTFVFSGNNNEWQEGQILVEDYPITFDDKFYFISKRNSSTKILSIEDGNNPQTIFSIFNGDPAVNLEVSNIATVDFSKFINYKLIILNHIRHISSGLSNALNQYLENGGSIFLIPSANADINAINSFLMTADAGKLAPLVEQNTEVTSLNMQEEEVSSIFASQPKKLDLPKVKKYYPILSSSRSNERMLLRMNNGASLLSKFYCKRGIVYLQATPLQPIFSDIATKAIYPAIVYNFSIYNSSNNRLYYNIGDNIPIVVDGNFSQNEEKLKVSSGNIEFVPFVRPQGQQSLLFLAEGIQQAGNLSITSNGAIVKKVAYNFQSNESKLDFFKLENIKSLAKKLDINIIEGAGIKTTVAQAQNGIVLWKLFLLLALVFLIIEMILNRIWK